MRSSDKHAFFLQCDSRIALLKFVIRLKRDPKDKLHNIQIQIEKFYIKLN